MPPAGKPRVDIRPHVEVAYTLGPEAAELCRLAGQTLDPWQRDAVDAILSVRPDGKWAAFECCEWVPRQNGKGAILEARALAGLFLLDERLIMWSAHEVKTATEAFRRLRALVNNLITAGIVDESVIKFNGSHGEEGIERLDTGQRLRFVARSKQSGRGFTGDVNIIDETFAYTEEQQDALTPTMTAIANPQIVYTSSPPLTGDSGEIMFALKKRADAGGDATLSYRDWGIQGDLDAFEAVDLDDRGLWKAANPAWDTRAGPDAIQRNRGAMSARGFARECLGMWPKPKQGGGSIDVAQWAALLDPGSSRVGDVSIAVDITPRRDYTCISLYGRREDDLGHLKLADYRPGTDWVIGRLVELRDALPVMTWAMGRGTYMSLRAELEKAGFKLPDDPHDPEHGDLLVAGSPEMAAATGQMIDAVRQESLRHVGDQVLDTAVAGAQVRETPDAIAWSRKESADVSPLVAASLARYGMESRAHLLDKPDIDVTQFIF